MTTEDRTEDAVEEFVMGSRAPVRRPAPLSPEENARNLALISAVCTAELDIGKPLVVHTYKNVSKDRVRVHYSVTTKVPPTRDNPKGGSYERPVPVEWRPNEELAVPLPFSRSLHALYKSSDGTVYCGGGQAPVQLVRTSPRQRYSVHPSLIPGGSDV